MENNLNKKIFSVQQLAYFLIVMAFLIGFLVIAKPILVPIFFAIFFTFMLIPLCTFFERFVPGDILPIVISFFVVIIPIVGTMLLFSLQVADVFKNLPYIGEEIQEGIDNIFTWIQTQLQRSGIDDRTWANEQLNNLIDEPFSFIQSGIASSTTILASIFLTLLYTFFLLYYRTGLKNFAIVQFQRKFQKDAEETLVKIQKVSQQYISGLGLVMLIMGSLNSLGLYFIGIEYPVLWGFLAAFLTIVPYIGTFIGGIIPFLYAVATTDTFWQPTAVIFYYFIIQQVEGNLITPKIVGDSVKVNPLAAIFSLIIGGYLWGISGLILALPVIATLRIIFEEVNWLKPVALLLSNDLYQKRDKFHSAYNAERYRLNNIFRSSTSKTKSDK